MEHIPPKMHLRQVSTHSQSQPEQKEYHNTDNRIRNQSQHTNIYINRNKRARTMTDIVVSKSADKLAKKAASAAKRSAKKAAKKAAKVEAKAAAKADTTPTAESPELPTTSEKKAKKSKKEKKHKKDKKRTAPEEVADDDSPTDAKPKRVKPAVVDADVVKEVDAYREKHKIKLEALNGARVRTDDASLLPLTTLAAGRECFGKLAFQAFDGATKGFKTPTPIQAQAWPLALSGADMVGIAATGSGKTLAFVLPGLTRILRGELGPKTSPAHPRVLVLAPTRELAIQSANVATAICNTSLKAEGLRSCVVYGGQPKREQKADLRQGNGVDVIVATPGRLLDFVEEKTICLENVGYLVLDEADQMLDMGFEQTVRRIVTLTKPKEVRQTVMFSATWPTEIRKLANEFLRDGTRVTIGKDELKASITVKQMVEVIEPHKRDARLLQLLGKVHNGKNRIIVFGLYKMEVARIEALLLRNKFVVAGIQGDKSQQAREAAVESFRSGETPILVATDVAARGLDIKDVEVVINYAFPLTVDSYVHRIGRTGRAGAKGEAYTFFTPENKPHAGALQNVLRSAGMEVPESLAAFGNQVKKKTHKLWGNHFRDIDPNIKAKHVKFGSDSDDE